MHSPLITPKTILLALPMCLTLLSACDDDETEARVDAAQTAQPSDDNDAGAQPPADDAQTDPDDRDATSSDDASMGETTPDAGEVHDATTADADEHEHTGAPVRLLIADSENANVTVLDVEDGATVGSFTLTGVSRVYSGPSGRFGYAVQGADDLVQVISSGLHAEDHGDHVDYDEEPPSLLDFHVLGDYPVHFVPEHHAGSWIGMFFDNEGKAYFLDESSLLSSPSLVTVDTGMPHHGVALRLGDRILATRPELLAGATRATPTGVAVYDLKGSATGQVFGGCTGVHGEATLTHTAAFGCTEGVLLIEQQGGELRARLLQAPSTTVTPAPRVGTLVSHTRWPFMVSNLGSDALATVDPVRGLITRHPVPPYVQFAFSEDGEQLLVLTKDGSLHVLAPDTFEESAQFAVTSPATDDSGHGARYPQFGVSHDAVYVTDPAARRVHAVSIDQRRVLESFDVAGSPAKIAVLTP